MIQVHDDVGKEVRCGCGCIIWREPVLKGPNAGQMRSVTVDGSMHYCNGVPHRRDAWTADERAYVATNYGPMTAGQIALALNRAVLSVREVIKDLNKQRRQRK